jgi:hypothetical protein
MSAEKKARVAAPALALLDEIIGVCGLESASDEIRENDAVRRYLDTWAVGPAEILRDYLRGEISAQAIHWKLGTDPMSLAARRAGAEKSAREWRERRARERAEQE